MMLYDDGKGKKLRKLKKIFVLLAYPLTLLIFFVVVGFLRPPFMFELLFFVAYGLFLGYLQIKKLDSRIASFFSALTKYLNTFAVIFFILMIKALVGGFWGSDQHQPSESPVGDAFVGFLVSLVVVGLAETIIVSLKE